MRSFRTPLRSRELFTGRYRPEQNKREQSDPKQGREYRSYCKRIREAMISGTVQPDDSEQDRDRAHQKINQRNAEAGWRVPAGKHGSKDQKSAKRS